MGEIEAETTIKVVNSIEKGDWEDLSDSEIFWMKKSRELARQVVDLEWTAKRMAKRVAGLDTEVRMLVDEFNRVDI